MKARVKATGEIVYVFCEPMIGGDGYAFYTEDRDRYLFDDLDFNIPDYWTRLEHQYAGMAMQGLLVCEEWKISPREGVSFAGEVALQAHELAHALVKKVRYEENPEELEGLKIEKTILENKIKLLKEERK